MHNQEKRLTIKTQQIRKKKSKFWAVFLAWIVGPFTFLYTYKKDKWKFWLTFPFLIGSILFTIIYFSYFYLEGPVASIYAKFEFGYMFLRLGIAFYQSIRSNDFFEYYYLSDKEREKIIRQEREQKAKEKEVYRKVRCPICNKKVYAVDLEAHRKEWHKTL